MPEPDPTDRRQKLLAFASSILVSALVQSVLTHGQGDPLGRAILSAVAVLVTLVLLLLAVGVASWMGREAIATGFGWGVAVSLLVGMGWCLTPGL